MDIYRAGSDANVDVFGLTLAHVTVFSFHPHRPPPPVSSYPTFPRPILHCHSLASFALFHAVFSSSMCACVCARCKCWCWAELVACRVRGCQKYKPFSEICNQICVPILSPLLCCFLFFSFNYIWRPKNRATQKQKERHRQQNYSLMTHAKK